MNFSSWFSLGECLELTFIAPSHTHICECEVLTSKFKHTPKLDLGYLEQNPNLIFFQEPNQHWNRGSILLWNWTPNHSNYFWRSPKPKILQKSQEPPNTGTDTQTPPTQVKKQKKNPFAVLNLRKLQLLNHGTHSPTHPDASKLWSQDRTHTHTQHRIYFFYSLLLFTWLNCWPCLPGQGYYCV